MNNSLQDAMLHLNQFSKKTQAKIRFWYPKIKAAQEKARAAHAAMADVLNEPPIAIGDPICDRSQQVRRKLVANYEEAWAAYKKIIAEYGVAKGPACDCDSCIAAYMNGGKAVKPADSDTQKPRRSARLAAKPRVNYME